MQGVGKMQNSWSTKQFAESLMFLGVGLVCWCIAALYWAPTTSAELHLSLWTILPLYAVYAIYAVLFLIVYFNLIRNLNTLPSLMLVSATILSGYMCRNTVSFGQLLNIHLSDIPTFWEFWLLLILLVYLLFYWPVVFRSTPEEFAGEGEEGEPVTLFGNGK